MKVFEEMFGKRLPIIGVVHLQPLPGAPRYEGMPVKEIAREALEEATTMIENGIDGLIVENFRDMMFKKLVGAETVAAMTFIASEVTSRFSVPVGLCVLQSDPISALAIAKAVDGKFIRVPYYTETYVVDTGMMESVAADALRFRKMIYAKDVKIFADVHIKHGYPLSRRPIEESAEDAYERGLADAIIITGRKTGGKTRPEDVRVVREYLPEVPLIVGSGVTPENLEEYFPSLGDAVIVGTSLKRDGKTEAPIDPERVRRFSRSMERFRKELEK
jgi:membrane complex biogenesis BtpA family protein